MLAAEFHSILHLLVLDHRSSHSLELQGVDARLFPGRMEDLSQPETVRGLIVCIPDGFDGQGLSFRVNREIIQNLASFSLLDAVGRLFLALGAIVTG